MIDRPYKQYPGDFDRKIILRLYKVWDSYMCNDDQAVRVAALLELRTVFLTAPKHDRWMTMDEYGPIYERCMRVRAIMNRIMPSRKPWSELYKHSRYGTSPYWRREYDRLLTTYVLPFCLWHVQEYESQNYTRIYEALNVI